MKSVVASNCLEPWKISTDIIELQTHNDSNLLIVTTDLTRPNAPLMHIEIVGQNHSHEISLDTTPQHLGGVRWWMRCPTSGNRCHRMFYKDGDFMSGPMLRAPYRSQQLGSQDRYVWRANKLVWRHGMQDVFSEKPKGMHSKTYDRVMQEAYGFIGRGIEARPPIFLEDYENELKDDL